MSRKVIVRNITSADIKPLIELQKRVYPTIQPWREDLLLHQLDIFPHGQFVAEIDGELVGASSSVVVAWDEWQIEHTWKEIIDRGSFDTHNPQGRTLYAAEVFVHPHKRGTGIACSVSRAPDTVPAAQFETHHSLRPPAGLPSLRRPDVSAVVCPESRVGRYS